MMQIQQLEKRMKRIKPGDVIHFNSVGACRVPGDKAPCARPAKRRVRWPVWSTPALHCLH